MITYRKTYKKESHMFSNVSGNLPQTIANDRAVQGLVTGAAFESKPQDSGYTKFFKRSNG